MEQTMDKKNIIVAVNEGKIRGIKKKSFFSGVEYYSFLGIPYGQNTAGLARFKDPVKVKPWNHILNGTVERGGCYQYSIKHYSIIGSEDCLYNNIHTTRIPNPGDSLSPVIALIHPGGNLQGSPDPVYYGSPDYLMNKDIVYVGICFRLHVLGFLNLGLEECSGNQGYKDIILSLRWIKENISVFGGDPNNITLIGSSSGSAIVHALMLSPTAKGLFHKAVIMGIHSFNPTIITRNDHKKEAYQLAKAFKYETTDENDDKRLLSFMKRSLHKKFVEIRPQLSINRGLSLFPCSPFSTTVDQGKNSVLPKPLDQLIPETHRIPVIFGMCERETAIGFIRLFEKETKEYFYKSYRQNIWAWGRDITDDQVNEIKKQIDDFYFNGGTVELATLPTKVDVQTDISYSNLYDTFIDVVAADLPSSVFVYKFQFEGNIFTIRRKIESELNEPLDGTYHADDFSYWAHLTGLWKIDSPILTPKIRYMIETFTRMITTFAKNGNPNYEGLKVEWKPTTPENPCYLIINDPPKMVEGKLNHERMKFWENIMKKYKK